ncbi:hypothetical protein BDQ12DRAFT_722291 [Crucibulum laeve]|uniref:CBM1 domain-containing protein n=1 Tax=Crucibulum laeve TaxID=68775 RepID=A0A5C3M2D9_9AGAR|nr:hypothetical protein BDQ12DRAFT_722290 [Crucibulum laeve]TFK39420.1 hypothetical protein BDQ12DRAFT_722291 [Crucibulum laeve]
MARYWISTASLSLLLFTSNVASTAAPLWGQCGGYGFVGPTTCVEGATCVRVNEFYSCCYLTVTSTTSTTSVAVVTSSA